MSNLEDRLRTLDTIDSPDLWPEIGSGRSPRPSPPEPGARRRVVATSVSLILLVLIGIILSRTLPGTRGTTVVATQGPGMGHGGPFPLPIEVSAVTPDGSAGCTANFPSSVVQPGEPTGVSVTLKNLLDVGIQYDRNRLFADVMVSDASGIVLWDAFLNRPRSSGPYREPDLVILSPGETIQLRALDDVILWPGPLTITVVCPMSHAAPTELLPGVKLPPVQVQVAVPGPTPEPGVALDRALQKASGLFDECRPSLNNPPTIGLIRAPDGSDVPPMAALCMVDVQTGPGFDVVTLSFQTPPDGPLVDIPDNFYLTKLPGAVLIEVGRWIFLVTDDSVKEISSLAVVGRSLDVKGLAPNFEYRDGTWARASDMCGARFYFEGIVFISACSR